MSFMTFEQFLIVSGVLEALASRPSSLGWLPCVAENLRRVQTLFLALVRRRGFDNKTAAISRAHSRRPPEERELEQFPLIFASLYCALDREVQAPCKRSVLRVIFCDRASNLFFSQQNIR